MFPLEYDLRVRNPGLVALCCCSLKRSLAEEDVRYVVSLSEKGQLPIFCYEAGCCDIPPAESLATNVTLFLQP